MGNLRTLRLLPLVLFVLSWVTPEARAEPLAPADVPAPLRDWVTWATADEATYGCTREGETLVCAWPGLLELTITGNDVGFSLYVVLDRERFVALPGSASSFPVDVREGTRPLVVIASEDGDPIARLPAGTHRVDGRVRFGQRPESLKVPGDVARIVAILGAARVPLTRASEGIVPLHGAALASAAETTEAETDSVSIEIVRRVADGVPLSVHTQITARVSGRSRSIALGNVLVAGTVPSAVESTLPIQVGADGHVVLQAQSGTHRIRIASLGADPRMPLVAPRLPAPWPAQEIWLFAPSEMHRQVEITGPSSIDPQSPSIPEDWRSSAAYVLSQGERMTLVERRRGEPLLPPNALRLSREMWLDFDGGGFTVRDHVSGEMHRSSRLDLVRGELGRVTLGGVDQLITLPARGPRGARGIEVRDATVDIRAESRFRGSPTDVPAVGWSEDVRSLSVQLNLPPGYTLFAASGVDRADSAWLEGWDVGPLFLVLLIAVVVARLFDKRSGFVALVTLVLIYFERDAPTFLWLFVLVPFAVLKLFQKGTFARLVYVVFAALGAALALTCAFFITSQLRYAMHPQLLTEEVTAYYDDGQMATSPSAEIREAASEYADVSRAASSLDEGRGAQDADRRSARLENWIDPNAVVQTGQGVVDWRHTQLDLAWTGPVSKEQRIHLYLVPPWLQRVLALARVLGMLFLLFVFAKNRPRWPSDGKEAPQASGGAVATLALLAALGAAQSARAQAPAVEPPLSNVAQEPVPIGTPILAELRERLLAPPSCAGACARFGDALLVAEGDTLRIELVAHADVAAALTLPGPVGAFVPDGVTLDGAATNALRALPDGHLSLRVPQGVHRIVLTASLAGRGSVALSFPHVPGRIEVRATGFSVSGVDENGLVRGSLELRRDITAASPETPGAPRASADVPNWTTVERHVEIGVQWLVTTKVARISATSAPAVVRIRALPGESVLGSEAVRDGAFLVATIPQGLSEVTFTSRITQGSEVRFTAASGPVAASDVHVTETWSYACSPLWSCAHEGLVPFHHASNGAVRPTFAPYPGESVRVTASRLSAAPGSSFTFDGARLTVSPGSRSRESTLDLEVRTSVSNTLRVTLPRGAEVQSVEVDGARRAVQLRSSVLTVGIVPSNHAVRIVFVEPRGLELRTTTPVVKLGGETVDVHVTVNVPESRWLLFASGPSWGPIVLFWGQLAFVLLVAVILGRIPRSPLRMHEWALLVLGLTQIPLPATFVVAGWFFAVKVQHERRLSGTLFNVAQLALVLYAFVSACILITAAWVGLNDRPDMQIVGNGSSADTLHFYADRARDALPSASFVSVSVWVWKGLMLAWAFWLAYSVVRWALWAVSPFREQGFFTRAAPDARPTPVVVTPAVPVARAAPAPEPAPAPAPAPEPASNASPVEPEPSVPENSEKPEDE